VFVGQEIDGPFRGGEAKEGLEIAGGIKVDAMVEYVGNFRHGYGHGRIGRRK
jgi:hypothetical protein